MTLRIRVLLFFSLVLLVSANCARAATPREIAANVLPSVVSLTVYDSNGLPLKDGTGFFVTKDEVATNYHVLAGGFRATARMTGSAEPLEIAGVVAADKSSDLAILRTSSSAGHPLGLSPVEPAIGDAVYVAGNPAGLAGTFSSGIVSGKREIEGATLIQITAPISPGSSGSPVVNERSEVVGVAVASMRLGQSLNFAVPVNRLATIYRDASLQTVAAAFQSVQRAKVVEPHQSPRSPPSPEFASSDGMLTAYAFTRDSNRFSFTTKNNTQSPVCRIDYIVIAYGNDGRPIDSVMGISTKLIPPDLAIRFNGIFAQSMPLNFVDHCEVRLIRYQVFHPENMYLVKPSDTGIQIARAMGASLSDIEAANPGIDWRLLRVGQAINYPPKPPATTEPSQESAPTAQK